MEGLTALWLLVEVWGCGSRGLPSIIRERWLLSALFFAGWSASALRQGIEWGLPPLLDRTSCAALALCFYWYFRREGKANERLLPPIAAATAVAVVMGLTTLSAHREAPALFGNVNLAAQFLGFALLVLAFVPTGQERGRVPLAVRGVLGLASGAYLCLLGTRSVALGLAAAALAHMATRLSTPRRSALFSAGALAVVAVAMVALPLPGTGAGLKAESGAARLAVWETTLRLIRHHPFGVGAANFGDAFLPYQAQGGEPPRETELYLTPHNEYLRVAAEDGILVAVIAAILVARLMVGVWRRASREGREESLALLVPLVTFLGVECLFQFPFMVAPGATMTALIVGLALAAGEPDGGSPEQRLPTAQARGTSAWPVAITVAAVAMLVALGRVASSDHLSAIRADSLDAQERACRLSPRNLPACVTAAWLRAQSGDTQGARSQLEGMLGRAPHYPPALKLLGELALQEGRAAEGCGILSRYDALFGGRSSVRELLRRRCAGFRDLMDPAFQKDSPRGPTA